MMNSLIQLPHISDTNTKKVELEVNYDLTTDFTDGKLDGENNFEPIAYQWSNSEYRQGYLIGVAIRLGIEYALIQDIEMNQVIFV